MASHLSLKQLASEKEEELKTLREQHTQILEEVVAGIRHELLVEREKLSQLQTDFEYNLSLLEERDQELSRYDAAFSQVRAVVNSLTAENSELKVRADSLREDVTREKENCLQMKRHYIHRIEELNKQMDNYRQSKDCEVEEETETLERLQTELRLKIGEVEGEVGVVKTRMAAEFDTILKKREREFTSKINELSTTVLSRETQLKQLSRELQLVQSSTEQVREEAGRGVEKVTRLERELRAQQWEREDQVNERDARIAELEGQLEHSQSTLRAVQGDFERRHAELDRQLREKEATVLAAKEAHRERELQLERELHDLQARLEQGEVEMRRTEWSHTDSLQEKDKRIERMEEEVSRCRRECEERVRGMEREGVDRDLRLHSLQEACDRLREDLGRRMQDVERFKQELVLSVERERQLQSSKAQLELDWRSRVEEVEGVVYSQHQEMIKQLSTARDQTLAECREMQQTLSQQSAIVQAVQQERDIAIATLDRHGLTEQYQLDCQRGKAVGEASGGHVTDPRDHMIQELRRQKDELHGVIQQMRREMEQLTDWSDQRANQTTAKPTGNGEVITAGYVKYLESELFRVKSENRDLGEKMQESRKPPTPPPSGDRRRHTPSPALDKRHRGHLIALSDTIASLQREREGLEAEVRRMEGELEEKTGRIMALGEQVYVLRATQVPKSKLHQKLLQATQVIISLVREKERLEAIVESLQSKKLGEGSLRPTGTRTGDGGGKAQLERVEEEEYRHARDKLKGGSPPRAVMGGTPTETLAPRGNTSRGEASSEKEIRKLVKNGENKRDSIVDPGGRSLKGKRLPTGEQLHNQTESSPDTDAEYKGQFSRHDDLELSLNSLRFVDSSEVEGEESARRALDLVDGEALSLTLQSHRGGEGGRRGGATGRAPRSSTPEPREVDVISHRKVKDSTAPTALKIRGSRVTRSVRLVGIKEQPKGERRKGVEGRRRGVRNYNIRD